MPLRRRLLTSSLLGAVPLIVLGAIFLLAYYQNARSDVLEHNLALARVGATYVQGWVEGNLRTLRTLAGANEAAHGTRADMQGLVQRQLRQQRDWDDLFITDDTGTNITVVAPHPPTAIHRDYFLQARKTGAPVVSNTLTSLVNQRPIVILAYPITRNGRFGGIVAAVISPQRLQEVFQRFNLPEQTIAALWGNDHKLIARTNTPPGMIGQFYPSTKNSPVFSGHPGEAVAVSPITGQRAFIGYVPVRGTSWTLVISTPLSDVLAPVYRTIGVFLVLTVAVLTFTIIWSLYSANYLSRQICALSVGAREIGMGNFDTRVRVHGGPELEELARSLNMMATNLAVIDRLKSDLLSLVSHELKTPLTTISSALEMLHTGVVSPDDPRSHELLAMAARQTQRLEDVIENLLNAARQQAGEMAVAPRPLPLRPIVLAAAEQFTEAAQQRGLSLNISMPEDLLVMAEAPRVALALNNLLDNAAKFTEHGDITVRVTQHDSQAVIAVTDTGIGLTPEVQRHLFERFYQAEPLLTRRTGGAGLGLFIVKAIAEAHGGHVFVESDGPEKGSTFGFTLPLADASSRGD